MGIHQTRANPSLKIRILMDTGFVISSFGEDEQGEIYLVGYKGGIYRREIVETPEPEVTPTS